VLYLDHLIILQADGIDRTIQFLYCFLLLENLDHVFETKWEHGCVLPSFFDILAGGDVAVYRAPSKEHVYINKIYKS